jgi:hypothetical protein
MPSTDTVGFVHQLGGYFSVSNGEISVDGTWSHSDSDEDDDKSQVVNAFDYFHCVSLSNTEV